LLELGRWWADRSRNKREQEGTIRLADLNIREREAGMVAQTAAAARAEALP
jgi:hypothetical protein